MDTVKPKVAKLLGFDLSTTALAAVVRSADSEEHFVSIPARGATKFLDQPAFNLAELPGMVVEALLTIKKEGWVFGKGGSVCFSVRQHDMALLGKDYRIAAPALSWQCAAATAEVARLKEIGVEVLVGPVEPRFILPKLMWLLGQMPKLREELWRVFTTGDYIAYALTGIMRVSTSDGLSNGLTLQDGKAAARKAFEMADLNPKWLPDTIQSGQVGGSIRVSRDPWRSVWSGVAEILNGWTLVAGLGDNHASAVGCGATEDDQETIYISAGTSGTAVRVCSPAAKLAGNAACFEFFSQRLLLTMLASCADRYDEFVRGFGEGRDYPTLNALAFKEGLPSGWEMHHETPPFVGDNIPSLGKRVAGIQAAIAYKLAEKVALVRDEVVGLAKPARFILTGGLTRSPFFVDRLAAESRALTPGARVWLINRKGPGANKTAAYGAMITAAVGGGAFSSFTQARKELCPLQKVP